MQTMIQLIFKCQHDPKTKEVSQKITVSDPRAVPLTWQTSWQQIPKMLKDSHRKSSEGGVARKLRTATQTSNKKTPNSKSALDFETHWKKKKKSSQPDIISLCSDEHKAWLLQLPSAELHSPGKLRTGVCSVPLFSEKCTDCSPF